MSSSKPDLRPIALFAALLVAGCSSSSGRPVERATARAPEPVAQPAVETAIEMPAPQAPEAPQPTPRMTRFDPAQAGLVVALPRGWKTSRRDAALIYEGPMRIPSVAMWEPEQRALDDAAAQLQAELGGALQSVRVTRKPERTTFAGYPAYVAEGTGRAEGFPMRWRATVVEGERVTLMLALAPTFLWGKGRQGIDRFERGIRAAPSDVVEVAVRR